MPNVIGGTVTWNLKVNADKFKRSLNSASKSMTKAGKGFKKQDKAVVKLGKSIRNLALGYLTFRAVAGSIRFLGGLTEKFEAQDQAVARLNASLKNVAGSTQEHVKELMDQARALQRVTTFGDEQIISAQALLGTFQQNKEAIGLLTPRILDMAASLEKSTGTSTDLEAITLAIGKSMTTGVGALTRYGVVISDAAVKAFDLADEQEKVNIITQELDKNFKGIAEASAKTLSGRMKQLSNQFGDFQETIGGVAQFVKVEMLSAFVAGSGGMEAWGNNALIISKQVGQAFLNMAKAVTFAMQGIATAAGLGRVAIEGGRQVKGGVAGFLAEQLKGQRGEFAESVKGFLEGQRLTNEELDKSIEKTLKASENWDNLNQSMVDARISLDEAKTGLEGITSIEDLMALSSKDAADGFKEMGEAAEDAAEKSGKELKKEQEELEKAKEKVISFRQKELDMTEKVGEAIKKQKLQISELKEEYDKAIASIKRNIEDLDRSFKRSEVSARESFLGQLASAASTARDTIKEREEMIQTELNNGEQADQKKIAELRALNTKEQAILDRNASIIEEADKIAADKRTAVGVKNLIDRFAREREIAKQDFERQKADLAEQLADKEEQFEKSNANIKDATIKTIADIRSSYIRMFDDLHRELKKLGEQFLALMKIGVVGAPGASATAQSNFANLIKGIPKRQFGGPVVANRPYLVGEAGPEIVFPESSGDIVPSGGNTFHFNISEKIDLAFVLTEVKRELGLNGLEANFGINK